MNLRQKTIENTFIVFVVTFFNRVLNILTKIILARLLLPEDFGLVAIATIIMNAVSLFREMGVESALVYRKKDVYEAADTAFIMMPIIGLLLYSIVYFIAPYAAEFYGEAVISDIVRISAVTLLLLSFGSVPLTLFEKGLDFRRRMIPDIVSGLVYAGSAISLALNGFGVWSMVYGGVLASFTGLLVIWLISPYRPTFRFSGRLARDMMDYGKYVLGAQIVIFVLTNVDNAVVGKVLDMTALGFYAMAYSIANMPATNITHVVGRILFPTYSVMQDDRGKLRVMFLKVVKYVSLMTVPASFALFTLAPELVANILGEKWIPAVPAMMILCMSGLLRSLNAVTGDLFKAVGDPKYLRDISIIQLIVIAILVIPAAKWGGIVGVAVLIVFKDVIAAALAFSRAIKEVGVTLKFLSLILKNQFSASLAAALLVYTIKNFYGSDLFALIAYVLIFATAYVGILISLDNRILIEWRELIRDVKLVHK